MSLADQLAAPDPVRIGTTLRLDRILTELDKTDADALRQALANPAEYTAPRIARALEAQGIRCDPNSVQTWRRRNGIT